MGDFITGGEQNNNDQNSEFQEIEPNEDFYDSELGQMGETEDEDQMSSLQKKMFEHREKILDKKLDEITKKAPNRFIPFFLPWEKKNVEEAKKHKKLRPKLMALSWRMNAARLQKVQQGISSITPMIPTIFYVSIGVIILITIASLIALILGEIDQNGNSTNGNAGGAAPMGPKGADFYAVRAVYSDDEQAEIDQIGDYINILRGVKEQIDTDISGLEITFNLELPEDEEINSFIENKNTGDWIIGYETMSEMADVVYKYDNEGGTETDLSAQLLAIKYFGYNSEIIDIEGDNNDLTDVIKANLLRYQSSLFAPKEDGGELPADLADTIDASVETYMSTVCDQRAEKFYIKDYILDGEEATMEGINKANYKAIILYPRGEFEAQFMQFYGINIDTEKFATYIDDNGTKIEFDITPEGNDDYYNKTTTEGQKPEEDPSRKMYNYEIDHVFGISATEQPTYLNTIVDGEDSLNLYDILLAQIDNTESSTILIEATDQEGNAVEGVYSYKLGGFAIITEYEEEFEFSIWLEPKSDEIVV